MNKFKDEESTDNDFSEFSDGQKGKDQLSFRVRHMIYLNYVGQEVRWCEGCAVIWEATSTGA
jgi:hypothetical protein